MNENKDGVAEYLRDLAYMIERDKLTGFSVGTEKYESIDTKSVGVERGIKHKTNYEIKISMETDEG